jgi:polyhydroxyalkanoate synthesis repressor PhaR
MKQASKIIIKKYPNRRLYNTLSSSYIKLEDVVTMVRKDEDFVVLDVKNDEDITRVILAQIILDYESKGYELLPENVVKAIIKFYGHPMSRFMHEYMVQMVKIVQGDATHLFSIENQVELQKQMEQMLQNVVKNFTDFIFGNNGKNK